MPDIATPPREPVIVAEPLPVSPTPPKKSWKSFFTRSVMIIILLILAIFTASYARIYFNLNRQLDTVRKESRQNVRTYPSPTPSSFIYTNDEWGISFVTSDRYEEASSSAKQLILGFAYNPTEPIIVFSRFAFKPYASYIKCNTLPTPPLVSPPPDGCVTDAQTITFGNKKAIEFGLGLGEDNGYSVVQTQQAPFIEFRMFASGGGMGGRFSQITSTFTFLDQKQVSRLTTPEADSSLLGYPILVQLAIKDLAVKLNVDAKNIFFVSDVKKTWSDSSLGCPQPGMRYMQALESGSLLTLQYNTKTYYYHTDDNQIVISCDHP